MKYKIFECNGKKRASWTDFLTDMWFETQVKNLEAQVVLFILPSP